MGWSPIDQYTLAIMYAKYAAVNCTESILNRRFDETVPLVQPIISKSKIIKMVNLLKHLNYSPFYPQPKKAGPKIQSPRSASRLIWQVKQRWTLSSIPTRVKLLIYKKTFLTMEQKRPLNFDFIHKTFFDLE